MEKRMERVKDLLLNIEKQRKSLLSNEENLANEVEDLLCRLGYDTETYDKRDLLDCVNEQGFLETDFLETYAEHNNEWHLLNDLYVWQEITDNLFFAEPISPQKLILTHLQLCLTLQCS